MRTGKLLTLGWAALLVGGAIAFIPLSRQTSAVEVALGVAAIVYGGLLGAFALGVLTKRPGPKAAIFGIAAGVLTVVLLRDEVAWPWYVPVGAAVTYLVGIVSNAFGVDGRT